MKKGLIFSIIGHIIIVTILSFKFNLNKPQIDLTTAVRVDMVGLPDKTNSTAMPSKHQEPPAQQSSIKDLKKVNLPVKSKNEAVQDKDISLKKSKQRQQEALKKLQKLSALDKIKDELAKEKEKTKGSPQPIKGEVIAVGTHPTGISKLEYDIFLGQIDATIKENWSLPQWLIDMPLRARVRVRISPNGQLISSEISSTSGNGSYDEFCVAAVEKSAPFPAVPAKFVEIFKSDGFIVGFPD